MLRERKRIRKKAAVVAGGQVGGAQQVAGRRVGGAQQVAGGQVEGPQVGARLGAQEDATEAEDLEDELEALAEYQIPPDVGSLHRQLRQR